MRIFLIFCFIFWGNTYLYAQDISTLEHDAAILLNQLRSSKEDSKTDQLHLEFKKSMANLVKDKGFFEYALKELQIADLKSADQNVRILTWNVEYSDLSHTYGGFILKKDEGRQKITVTELVDQLDAYTVKPEGVIDAKNWYGSIYYKIIDFAYQGKT